MEIEVQEKTPQPFLNRALDRIRNAWRDMAFGRSTARAQMRADLPEQDLDKLRGLIRSCLEEQRVETAARAEAARVGYLYTTLSETGRRKFLKLLADDFGLDAEALSQAVEAHLLAPSDDSYPRLQEAVRPSRVQLLKMLNSLPDGFKFLVDMRADLLSFLRDDPSLRVLDHDLKRLFESWFDVGLLTFEDITWDSPASLLEKLVAYEAVHEIDSWEDLKNRLDEDRRCYAFFHPKIPNEPLIFVEVALTRGIPGRIHDLLDVSAPMLEPDEANTAVFYSISSTHKGLRGISFGSFLLKQVMDRLAGQLPNLDTFVTLSPIPGFRKWLLAAAEEGRVRSLLDDERWNKLQTAVEVAQAPDLPGLLTQEGWHKVERIASRLEDPLMHLCAYYLLHERKDDGRPLDPVERFHIFNGARVERLNWMADTSSKGLEQSCGLMVNYLYEADELEENYERSFAGQIAASNGLHRLDRIERGETVSR